MASRTEAQQTGAAAEQRAFDHLRANGLAPVARNVACKLGEIDLVMRDAETIVFIEVRVRASDRFGGAAASITAAKQGRLRRAASQWLLRTYAQRTWPPCRFDVVAIEGHALRWIRAAF